MYKKNSNGNISDQKEIDVNHSALNKIYNLYLLLPEIVLIKKNRFVFLVIYCFLIVGLYSHKSYAQCPPPQLPCYNNLILNGGFEKSCITPLIDPDDNFYADAFDSDLGCIDNWYEGIGSPHIIVSPFNFVEPHEDGGFFYTCLAGFSYTGGSCYWAESIYQPLSSGKFYAGQNYNLSFLARSSDITVDVPIIGSGPEEVDVEIIAATGITFVDNCYSSYSSSELIQNLIDYDASDWEKVEICNFSLANDYDNLVFRGSTNGSNKQSAFLIDNIELWCESQLVPSFTYTNSGNVFTFSGTTTTVSGITVSNWYWDFGDGTTSTSQNPVHTFGHPGFTNVCLCITDNRGCTHKICGSSPPQCECSGYTYINADTTVSGNATYNSHIVVNGGHTLTFDEANVKLKRKCKILVKRNARLNVFNSQISGVACTYDELLDSWGGIQVWGTQNVAQPILANITGSNTYRHTNHGIVYYRNSSILNVRNDENCGAISAGPNGPFHDLLAADGGFTGANWENHFGGVIVAEGGSITNSSCGINFQKYPEAGMTNYTVSKIDDIDFDNCKQGISNSQTLGLPISNCTFTMPSGFYDNSIAMDILDAHTTIWDCTINNYRAGVLGRGLGLPDMRLRIGLYTDNASGNAFNDVIKGVHLNNVNRAEIFFNTFDFQTTSGKFDVGVWADGNNGYNISGNDFIGHMIGIQSLNASSQSLFNNLFCNSYDDYTYGIAAIGDNMTLQFNNEYIESGTYGLYYAGNPGMMANQGESGIPVWNNFLNSTTDIYTPSLFTSTTKSFEYFFPSTGLVAASFRPLCAVNNTGCSETAVFDEVPTATTGEFDCSEYDIRAVSCTTKVCINDFNDELDTRRTLLDNGDNNTVFTAVNTNHVTGGTVTSLNASNPYLSDRILVAIAQSSYFSEGQKVTYLSAHAPLNYVVSDAAATYMTVTSNATINAISGPSDRNIIENEIASISSEKWHAIAGFINDNYSLGAGYDSIKALLNLQPEPFAKNVLLQVQFGLGKYAEARDIVHYINNVTQDFKDMLWLYLNMQVYHTYVPTIVESNLLDALENDLTQDGSLARNLKNLITGEDYYPQMPYSGEDTRIVKPNNSALQEKYVNIQPNPATDEVQLTSKIAVENTEFEFTITDMNGKFMSSGSFVGKFTVQMSDWPQGIYFIQIQGANTFQLIKMIKI